MKKKYHLSDLSYNKSHRQKYVFCANLKFLIICLLDNHSLEWLRIDNIELKHTK